MSRSRAARTAPRTNRPHALPPRPTGPPPIWTHTHVHELNRQQDAGHAPRTCPHHPDVALFATRHGWICGNAATCPYRSGRAEP